MQSTFQLVPEMLSFVLLVVFFVSLVNVDIDHGSGAARLLETREQGLSSQIVSTMITI